VGAAASSSNAVENKLGNPDNIRENASFSFYQKNAQNSD